MAIPASELRIGNWVSMGPNSNFAIKIVWEKNLFSPIPLSPELLIKAGFEEQSSSWYSKHNVAIMLGYTEKHGDFFHFATTDKLVLSPAYKYVHQLQNIYYIIEGEELEISP